MKNSAFPTLLNKRAKIFASLNRADMAVMGIGFLFMSWIGVGGISAILIGIGLLAISKLVQSKLPKGYFRHLIPVRILKWSYKLGGICG
ncbi:MAG: hypothetical protein KAQ98_12985 [Bacteriovoracaceae bacterium]|nr:hypothetical protein [Bacteriovoracaceae bacterium]